MVNGAILWPHTTVDARREARRRRSPAGIASSAATSRSVTSGVFGDESVVTDFLASVDRGHVVPGIFKAYDVRGLYPVRGERRRRARDRARRSSATWTPTRIAVSRDMRVSSPALAAAFIDGAREQGADVVDYGMCRHRHALLRRRPRRARRRRANHRVAQPEANTTASRWSGARRFRCPATPASARSATW